MLIFNSFYHHTLTPRARQDYKQTMTQILRTKALQENLMAQLKSSLLQLKTPPHLHVILVGENPASQIYVNHKQQQALKAGMACTVHHLPEDTQETTLTTFIQTLNQDATATGILLQLPLPKQLNQTDILNIITPQKDVDGLTTANQTALQVGTPPHITPATPLAIMRILTWAETPITNQPTVVLGESALVGAPTAILLKQAGANVQTFNSSSPEPNKQAALKQATLIISATGQQHLINKTHIQTGATLIDVGITRMPDNTITGDIHPNVIGTATALTPVPGGVGPLTVTSLLTNTTDAAYQQQGLPKPNWVIPTC